MLLARGGVVCGDGDRMKACGRIGKFATGGVAFT